MTTLASNIFNGTVTVTGVAPSFTIPPQIDGEATSGETLEVSSFSYAGSEPVTIVYQRGTVEDGDVLDATDPSYVQLDSDYGKTIYWRVTLTNAFGTAEYTATAPRSTGRVFTEDWSAFTVGNTATELVASLYTRSSTQWECDVVSSTLSPSGKGLSWRVNTVNWRYANRNDIEDFSQANDYTIYEELFLIEHTGGATPTFWSRSAYKSDGLLLAPGFNIRADVVRHQVDADDVANANGDTMATLVANQKFFIRHQIEGSTSRLRLWDYGDPEPTVWNTRTHTIGTGSEGVRIGARASGGSELMHYYGCGFNASVPFPSNYSPPSELASDLLTFAAPSPGTTITMGSGDIVWSFEDA